MADGGSEITEIPCVYTIRHVPPRRKQAALQVVYEDAVVRVASWSAQEAPVVATLTPGVDPDELLGVGRARDRDAIQKAVGGRRHVDVRYGPRAEVVYRAARGLDGVVRMMAPLDGPAFAVRVPVEAGDLPRYAAAPLFCYPARGGENICSMQRANGLEVGTLVVSDRGPALARINTVAQRMAIIDGVMHAPCAEPGWAVDRADRHTLRGISLYASPDPAEWSNTADITQFLPATPRPADAYAMLKDRDLLGPSVTGSIETVLPNLLGQDPCWRLLRGMLQACLYWSTGREACMEMTGSEGVLRMQMMQAIANWPSERNIELAANAVRMVRVAHGGLAPGHRYMIDCVLGMETKLRAAVPPGLAVRLEGAGIVVGGVVPMLGRAF